VDRRVVALIVASVLLGGTVLIVLVARGGGEASADLTDTSVKPQIEVPSDPPPSKLVTDDIVEGEGPAAKDGDQLTLQYVGVVYDTGTEIDSSWGDPQPFQLTLGQGGVIPGWDQGIPGMKVGGRRELTIPPDLAYGPAGQPPDIPPNATLIFVIDLVSID
jgi:peptidylprolyl isomerase